MIILCTDPLTITILFFILVEVFDLGLF